MKKIVIIGAGPAGLTAAYELLKSGGDYDVTILEERGEVGGISRTVRHGGNRMDIGGHLFTASAVYSSRYSSVSASSSAVWFICVTQPRAIFCSA